MKAKICIAFNSEMRIGTHFRNTLTDCTKTDISTKKFNVVAGRSHDDKDYWLYKGVFPAKFVQNTIFFLSRQNGPKV